MLDLTSRSANVPTYQYLGGPTRYKARGLAHLEGETDDELVAALQRSKAQGFRVFTFPVPARDAFWRMQTYVDVIRKRFEALRAAGGVDTDYVIDGRESLTPGDASFIAKSLERSHLIWLDEPTSVLTNDALSRRECNANGTRPEYPRRDHFPKFTTLGLRGYSEAEHRIEQH
jgi:galactonate dehydratase